LERTLGDIAAHNPDRVSVHVGYDETRAHLIEAGSDAFLMPSRFEPCGLNQMYSLRYGTVPIVHNTGGLADTVVDASDENLANGSATGLLFNDSNVDALHAAVQRALHIARERSEQWRAMALNGMRQDLSWQASARRYEAFYAEALEARRRDVTVASA
jgi:starch synthase